MIRNSDPTYVVYKNHRYEIDTDYKTALRCLELSGDETVSDMERVLGIEYMLFGVLPRDNEEVEYLFNKAKLYLQCGEPEEVHLHRKRDMDFEQDYNFIEASFQSDYDIDLSTTHMSWWRFMRLLSGLTDKSVLSRVRQIRNQDLSEIKDPKYRSELARAKEQLALKEKWTEEEQAMINEFDSL